MAVNETFKFGFYRIDPKILVSLKEINSTVCDCVYIGPLMTVESQRGAVPLFAPLNAEFDENETVMQALRKNKYAGIDFNGMVPVTNPQNLINAGNEIPEERAEFYITSREALENFAKGAYERQ